MLVSIDYKGQRFRERVLLLRTLRNVVWRQIEFWDSITGLRDSSIWSLTLSSGLRGSAQV